MLRACGVAVVVFLVAVVPAAAVVLDDFNDGGIGTWQGATSGNSYSPAANAGTTLSNVNNALRMSDPGFSNGMTNTYLGALPAGVSVLFADVRVVTDDNNTTTNQTGNNCKLAAKPGGFFTANTQGVTSVAFARDGVDDSNSPFRTVAVALSVAAPTDLTLLMSGNIRTMVVGGSLVELEIDNINLVPVSGTPTVLDDFTGGGVSGWAGINETNAPVSASAFSTVAHSGNNTLRLIDAGGGRCGWVKNYPNALSQPGIYVVTALVRTNSAGGSITDLRMAIAQGLQVGLDRQTWPFSTAANLATGATVTVPTNYRQVAAALVVSAPSDLAVYFGQDVTGDFVGGAFNATTACELELDVVHLYGPISVGPSGPDLDEDGVPDAFEHRTPNATQTSDYLDDCDRDGLKDGQEDTNGNGVRDAGETNARARDSDGDGLTDGVERRIGTNPLSNTSPASFTDGDNDGLPATHDPDDADSDADNDRFRDGYEAALLGIDAVGNPSLKPTMGDVNGDATLSNLDALVTQSLFLGNLSLDSPVWGGPAKRFRNTDMNGDAATSNIDALIIQSYFLGNLPLLPL